MRLRLETVNNCLGKCSVFEDSGDAETTIDENLFDSVRNRSFNRPFFTIM